jgi:hypothetical protein
MKQLKRSLSLLLPVNPKGLKNSIHKEFFNENARRRWTFILMAIGLISTIGLTIKPDYIWIKDGFWHLWSSILVIYLLVLLATLMSVRLKMEFKRPIYIIVILAIFIWLYCVIKSGFGIIWPKLIASELLLLGIGLIPLKKNYIYYGTALVVLSFAVSLIYLVIR